MRQPPIQILNLSFRTKLELKEYTKKYLAARIGTFHPVEVVFLLELFKRHPRYPEKFHLPPKLIFIKKGFSGGFDITIKFIDGKLDNVSWNSCITRNKPRSELRNTNKKIEYRGIFPRSSQSTPMLREG